MSETIINGIDVSECEFYFEDNGVIAPDGTPERANICTSPERSCKNNDSCYCNKDCYFKQFKRLQKENEELKKFKKEISKTIVLPYIEEEVTNKYKQALEEIREIISGNYEILDPQAKQDIKKIIDEVLNDRD